MPDRAGRLKPITRKTPDQVRGSSSARGYDRAWRRTRDLKLKRDPLCEDCLENEFVEPAVEVHHVIKIAERPDLRLDIDNLRSLCKTCHSIRTARGE